MLLLQGMQIDGSMVLEKPGCAIAIYEEIYVSQSFEPYVATPPLSRRHTKWWEKKKGEN